MNVNNFKTDWALFKQANPDLCARMTQVLDGLWDPECPSCANPAASPKAFWDARQDLVRQTTWNNDSSYRHALEASKLILVSEDVASLAENVLLTTGIDEEWLDLIPDYVTIAVPRNCALEALRMNDKAADDPSEKDTYYDLDLGVMPLVTLSFNRNATPNDHINVSCRSAVTNPVAFMYLTMRQSSRYDAQIRKFLRQTIRKPNEAHMYFPVNEESNTFPMKLLFPFIGMDAPDIDTINRTMDPDTMRIRGYIARYFKTMPTRLDINTVQHIRFIAAVLALTQHLTFVHEQTENILTPTKRERKMAVRDNRPLPDYSVKTIYVTAEPPTTKAAETKDIEYHHRWIVSGHFRNQPYGPGGSLRRRQWIPPYIKGPAGAPLLNRTKLLSIK